MKKVPAIIAAFVVTSVVAIAMLVIGVNAFLNPTSVQAASSPSDAQQQAAGVAPADVSAQVVQLQQRIQEYQAREQQYQDQLNQAKQQIQQQNTQIQQANTQIQQASSEIQQYQRVLTALQQAGVIQVDRNGQIYLRGFRSDDSGNN